uniref:Uncharacterized protein n=1 Tax=Rhizophora mucronata TaxID=61149 RepID=A0A2P2PNS0_RHIMU
MRTCSELLENKRRKPSMRRPLFMTIIPSLVTQGPRLGQGWRLMFFSCKTYKYQQPEPSSSHIQTHGSYIRLQ